MLFEELEEGRHWNIEGVVAIVVLESLDLLLGGYATGLLEVLEGWLWLGIDRICEGREGLLLLVPEETALLEEEGNVVLATSLQVCQLCSMAQRVRLAYVVANNLADLRKTSIRNREHLNKLRILNIVDLSRSEE